MALNRAVSGSVLGEKSQTVEGIQTRKPHTYIFKAYKTVTYIVWGNSSKSSKAYVRITPAR